MNLEIATNRPFPLQSVPFFNFKILDKIGGQKVPVMSIFAPNYQKKFALKLFPYEGDQMNQGYENEVRFGYLAHPSVITFYRVQNRQKSEVKGKSFFSSYIVMEYCPYGDFSGLLGPLTIFRDEKLVRTYFHQLIEGLEYLHSNGVSHLDIKPDNLMLSEDFHLKIIDFDKAYKKGDPHILSRGTRNYRAPELRAERCRDTEAADIYAAGVTLFVMLAGYFPYLEDTLLEGHDTYGYQKREDPAFWEFHKKYSHFQPNQDFKDLYLSMVKLDVVERATIDDIKQSKWYNGPVYEEREVREIVSEAISKKK